MKGIVFAPKVGPQCTLNVSESTAPSIVVGNKGVLDAAFFGQLIRDRVSSPPSFQGKLAEKEVREKIAAMTWSPREFQKALYPKNRDCTGSKSPKWHIQRKAMDE